MRYTLDIREHNNGRWRATVLEMPGVTATGDNPDQAGAKVQARILHRLADDVERGKVTGLVSVTFAAMA